MVARLTCNEKVTRSIRVRGIYAGSEVFVLVARDGFELNIDVGQVRGLAGQQEISLLF